MMLIISIKKFKTELFYDKQYIFYEIFFQEYLLFYE